MFILLVMEKPKLSEPLNQSEVIVSTVQSFQAFDTIRYGDICWQIWTTAFEMEKGHERLDSVFAYFLILEVLSFFIL